MTIPTEQVNAEGAVVKTVQVASNGEQIGAASIGLLTAGPLGALAAWGAIRMFAGKWTPWMLTGIIAVVPLNLFQFAVLGGITSSLNDQPPAIERTEDSSQ